MDYRERGQELFDELNPRPKGTTPKPVGFAGELRDLSIDFAFGAIWARPGLSRRDRSLVTLGILIALRASNELEYHFPIALRNGLTLDELDEVVYQSAAYAGFPAAHLAQQVALGLELAELEDTP